MPAAVLTPAAPPAAVPRPEPTPVPEPARTQPRSAPPRPDLELPGVGPGAAGLTVPGAALASFAAFRDWKLSDDCPEWGKFEWIGDRARLDLMPESITSHAVPKLKIASTLDRRVEEDDLGWCVTDSTTVVSPVGGPDGGPRVLCEPDFAFVSHDSILSGRVTLTPKVNREGDFTEIVGPPEVVAELLSDSSTRKDTVDLPADLFALGVIEYWLADARTDPPALTIHFRGEAAFEPVAADADGFAASAVFGHRYRLETVVGRSGLRRTRLLERPLG